MGSVGSAIISPLNDFNGWIFGDCDGHIMIQITLGEHSWNKKGYTFPLVYTRPYIENRSTQICIIYMKGPGNYSFAFHISTF